MYKAKEASGYYAMCYVTLLHFWNSTLLPLLVAIKSNALL